MIKILQGTYYFTYFQTVHKSSKLTLLFFFKDYSNAFQTVFKTRKIFTCIFNGEIRPFLEQSRYFIPFYE